MGRGPASRLLVIAGGLLLIGILLRLLMAIFTPILPASLMQDLSAGWQLLHSMIAPAMAPLMAVAILAAVVWMIMGWWRRY
jgi:hypothetical protein